MNREILFRGKRIYNGEWAYGHFCEFPCDDGTDIPSIIRIESKENHRALMQYPVISETVGRFTGLTDKNGVRIFECDVLRFRSGDYVVKWCNGHSKFLQVSKSFSRELYICIKESEVIGNIHDNPELLKGEPNV